MGNLHQNRAFRIDADNRTIESHDKDDQRKTDGISQTDNPVTQRNYLLFLASSQQIADQRAGSGRKRIDNDKEQCRDTAYDIGGCQFHFSQMLDSYKESKSRCHPDKRMEHAPYRHTTNMM